MELPLEFLLVVEEPLVLALQLCVFLHKQIDMRLLLIAHLFKRADLVRQLSSHLFETQDVLGLFVAHFLETLVALVRPCQLIFKHFYVLLQSCADAALSLGFNLKDSKALQVNGLIL